MIRPSIKKRGVALLVAMALIVLLLGYSIVAQTAVMGTKSFSRVNRDRLQRDWQRSALIATLQGRGISPPEGKNSGVAVQARALAADDPAWRSLQGIAPKPGDTLATLRWELPPQAEERYLINTQGRRRGAILLPGNTTAITTATATVGGVP